jgi:hypothetical protein
MDHILLADELGAEVRAFYARYRDLDDEAASRRPGEGSWSPKEIIGHLIDSASNNHQRFVRLQIQDRLSFPDYGMDNKKWVTIEHYNGMRFDDLLSLWKQYNVLLENIIRSVDPSKLQNCWETGEKSLSLMFLMSDYLRHLKEHAASFDRTLEQLKY